MHVCIFLFYVLLLRNMGSNILCQAMIYLLLDQGNILKGIEHIIINMTCRLLDLLQVVSEALEILIIFNCSVKGGLLDWTTVPCTKDALWNMQFFQTVHLNCFPHVAHMCWGTWWVVISCVRFFLPWNFLEHTLHSNESLTHTRCCRWYSSTILFETFRGFCMKTAKSRAYTVPPIDNKGSLFPLQKL